MYRTITVLVRMERAAVTAGSNLDYVSKDQRHPSDIMLNDVNVVPADLNHRGDLLGLDFPRSVDGTRGFGHRS
jgi:hypothetical protein